jgi:hypothetical protein
MFRRKFAGRRNTPIDAGLVQDYRMRKIFGCVGGLILFDPANTDFP